MGTPDIAVPALQAITKEYEVVGLFCQPDKPVGRKQVLTPPPTKVAAGELGIPVFQPKRLGGWDVFGVLKEQLRPDIIVVMAYGKILPENILNLPKYGCINAHASLLPKYRGAAPIQYAILNGETKTGITIMRMDEGIDTGDILFSKEVGIKEEDDAVSMFKKLGETAAELLPESLLKIEAGDVRPVKQENEKATFAAAFDKEIGRFSFFEDAKGIVNRVRAFAIWPNAFFEARDRGIKVFKAAYRDAGGRVHEVLSVNPLIVAAKNGAVELKEVMPAGGKRMDGTAFAAGLRLKKGDILSETAHPSAVIKE